MFTRLFLAHPRSVNETYLQHAQVAAGFGGHLIVAGLACLVHAAVPVLFTTTASRKVARLHIRMCADRMGAGRAPGSERP